MSCFPTAQREQTCKNSNTQNKQACNVNCCYKLSFPFWLTNAQIIIWFANKVLSRIIMPSITPVRICSMSLRPLIIQSWDIISRSKIFIVWIWPQCSAAFFVSKSLCYKRYITLQIEALIVIAITFALLTTSDHFNDHTTSNNICNYRHFKF